MSMIYRWILFIALFGISLSCSDHPKNSSSDMEPLDIVELRPADKWLKFPIDEDTDIGWYPMAVEAPDLEGREAILKVHAKGKPFVPK